MSTVKTLNHNYKILYQEIKNFLKSKDPKYAFKIDLRGKLFAIEGILRLNLKAENSKLSKNDAKTVESILNATKAIEDELGKYSLAFEMQEFAGQIEANEEIPAATVKKLKSDIIAARKLIHKDLTAYRKLIPQHQRRLSQVKFPKDERKFVKKALTGEIKRTKEKIKDLKPLILAKKYGYEELEEGFHEFRRMIRWISIYIQSYKEFFDLDVLPEKLSPEESELVTKYKDSPFTQLGKGDLKINSLKYYLLSDYIKTIGEIKTQGEMRYYLEERYDLAAPKKYKIEPAAHAIFKQFLDDKVFKHLLS